MKRILHEYYYNMGNRNIYREVKERSLWFVVKLKKGISEEGYMIREKLLVRNEEAYEGSIEILNSNPE